MAATVSFIPGASQGYVPLSVRLEDGTAATRREAEQALFLQGLFRGRWGNSVYGQLVRGRHYVTYLQCLLEIYGALEVSLETLSTHPVVGGFLHPELWRSLALQEDLRCFLGESWHEAPRDEHLTSLHLERIRQVSLVSPHLLVAHAYARCIRDILPSPQLAPQVAQAFDLTEGEGTAFYQSATASSVDALRLRVLQSLDSLPLSEEEVRAMVKEARIAFRLDTLLFDALARSSLGLNTPGTA